MIKNQIEVSASFKKQSVKAIYAIILFIISYLLLLVLAVSLTGLCVYAGIKIVVGYPSIISLVGGIGLASFGFLILFFLIKFVFKSNKTNYAMLTQITREEQPKLFKMLDEIVAGVGTDLPKKVFLSAEVNASVFYDSNFWSMFFPVRKNLMIGMGLVNTITDTELKAILSHEFGHFSQKSMKVGSYVYNVNLVLYNMLYDNEGFEKLMGNLAASSGIFSIFTYLAGTVLRGIQWLLQKLYTVVNLTYMGLSREMEFHADQIAAGVTGYLPLKESLLRMSLAEHAYNSVLGFYESRINEGLRSNNIFPEQHFVMNYLAKESNLPIENGLPKVSLAELNKFNKSKLVIKDQWASHPAIEERINYLEKVAEPIKTEKEAPAISVFNNITALSEKLTDTLFETVNYEGEVKKLNRASFVNMMTEEFEKHSFHKIYNSYYDQGNPIFFDIEKEIGTNTLDYRLEDLYSDAKTDLKFTALSLRSDIEMLDLVADKAYKIKTFDYDGQKYLRKDSKELQKKLVAILETVNEKLLENDKNIFRFFRKIAEVKNDLNGLVNRYHDFFNFDGRWDDTIKIYDELSRDLEFTSRVTPFKHITNNFKALEPKEVQLKKQLEELLKKEEYKKAISTDEREIFEKYLKQDWIYFEGSNYNEENLKLLFTTLNAYPGVLSKIYFQLKKSLLDFQVSLINGNAEG
jgi:Zn-dependent protease with chaperone function